MGCETGDPKVLFLVGDVQKLSKVLPAEMVAQYAEDVRAMLAAHIEKSVSSDCKVGAARLAKLQEVLSTASLAYPHHPSIALMITQVSSLQANIGETEKVHEIQVAVNALLSHADALIHEQGMLDKVQALQVVLDAYGGAHALRTALSGDLRLQVWVWRTHRLACEDLVAEADRDAVSKILPAMQRLVDSIVDPGAPTVTRFISCTLTYKKKAVCIIAWLDGSGDEALPKPADDSIAAFKHDLQALLNISETGLPAKTAESAAKHCFHLLQDFATKQVALRERLLAALKQGADTALVHAIGELKTVIYSEVETTKLLGGASP